MAPCTAAPPPARWQSAEIQPLTADIVATEGDLLSEMIRHPDHVTRTAHGDPTFYALCPSSSAVRDYACRLVQEIGETFAPNRIEIERADFTGFAHGYHDEKDSLPLWPQDTFLLGLSFCPHCLTAAHAAAIPAAVARRQAATLLDNAFTAELQAFIAWRSTPVTALIAELTAGSARLPSSC